MVIATEVIGDKELNAALAKLAEASNSPFTEFQLAGPLHRDFLDIEEDWFQNAGFGEWPELAKSTIEKKSKTHGALVFTSILRETDRLYLSLTRQTSDSIFEVLPNEVTFGTSVPYARYHMGASGRRPARPPIRKELRPEDREKMLKTINKQARKFSKGMGFVQESIGDFE